MRELIRCATPASSSSRDRWTRSRDDDNYSATPRLTAATRDTLLDTCQRLAWLGRPLLGDGTVVKVFPQARLLLELDLDGCLASGTVNNELNTFHEVISFRGIARSRSAAAANAHGQRLGRT